MKKYLLILPATVLLTGFASYAELERDDSVEPALEQLADQHYYNSSEMRFIPEHDPRADVPDALLMELESPDNQEDI